MRPETESLEGLGGQSRKGPCGAMPAWSFVFYCLTTKIGTLGERPLVAQSGPWVACKCLLSGGERVAPGVDADVPTNPARRGR